VTAYLLDVNALLALTDPMHIHHDLTRAWYIGRRRGAWATCPITENGYVRIASNPNYPNRPGDAFAVLGVLRRLCALPDHQFWAEDVSIRDMLDDAAFVSHTHITDAYLLGLAAAKRGKLATLDRGIPVHAVRNGSDAIEVISTAA